MRRFLKPGTVLGVIAVVIAMTGSAVAGSLITSVSIKDGTIKARDIRRGTINESRLSADVRNQLSETGEDGADGPAGQRGPQGVRGDSGPQGPRGERGHTGPEGLGLQGPAGNPGKSAFEVWKATAGNENKTQAEYLASLHGPKGDTGAPGLKGDKGDTGLAGPMGETGETGEPGATGPQGAKGDNGETGARGETGAKGEPGVAGPEGEPGEKGEKGEAGPQGEKGEKGEPGAKGDKGDPGVAGPEGDKGDRGETGATGANGAKGDTGAAGAKGDTGASAFDIWLALPGTEGDETAFIASLVGAQGEKGERGEQGQQGPAGPLGERGPQGEQGPAGPQGTQGPAGAQGVAGLDSDRARIVGTQNLRGFTFAPKGDNGDAADNGTIGFATPPVAPTLGTKSLKFTSATGKPVVVYLPLPSGYDAVNGPRPLLGEVTKVSYGSLIDTQPQSALDIGFQFEVLKANVGTASGYATVVFEPYQSGASETPDEWHRHSVDIAKVWSTRALPSGDCTQAVPCPFRVFREQNPYAEVLTAKLKIGQNSGQGWPGFEGFVDDLSFGFGPVTRYDFGG